VDHHAPEFDGLTGASTHRQLATSLRQAILAQEILGRANATFAVTPPTKL
jgi:hypothetical protein